jgi:(p)ppGpp synthase/HD superfamily hydrolase
LSEAVGNHLGPEFAEAVAYAIDAHGEQVRKATDMTYVSHLLSVAALVLEMGSSQDEAIAGLLHDTIEDAGGPEREADIARRFGPEVAALVRANSDTDVVPKPPWLQRKRTYIDGIAVKPPAAVRISIADKLHNARSILDDFRRHGPQVFDRFSSDADGHFASKREGLLWYYESLIDAFAARSDEIGPGAAAKLEDLREAVGDLRRVSG